MTEQIKINNPQEIISKISSESEVLSDYVEILKKEAEDLVYVENNISNARQILDQKKMNLYTEIEYAKRLACSDEKFYEIQQLGKDLEELDRLLKLVKNCSEEMVGIKSEASSLIKEARSIADAAKVLTEKIKALITHIIACK